MIEYKDDVHEQHLASMVHVLRRFLGNRATSGQWQKEMRVHGGPGWSKSAFKRRLKMLKDRKWVWIVGGSDAMDVERAPQGALFETTEAAVKGLKNEYVFSVSDEAEQLGSKSAHEESDSLVNAAIAQLQRLKRGRSPAS
jgi:hypothetical protein